MPTNEKATSVAKAKKSYTKVTLTRRKTKKDRR
jgi:hypothetical protein